MGRDQGVSGLAPKIRQDLDRSGFPLEIEVGSKFSNGSWKVTHQPVFRDEDENRSRYTDIAATKTVSEAFLDFSRLTVRVVCECKRSNKPWIFYTPPSDELKDKTMAVLSYLKFRFHPSVQPGPLIGRLYESHYLSKAPTDRLGQAYYIAFRDSPNKEGGPRGYDQIFDATNQVLKALRFQVSDFETTVRKMGRGMPTTVVLFYPLIVFDGQLYQYFLTHDEESVLEETSHVKYRVAFLGSSDVTEQFLVDVIAKKSLSKYLDQLDQEMEAITRGKS